MSEQPQALAVVEPVLSLRDLNISFYSDKRDLSVVNSVGFNLMSGKALGSVGEPGCGKTMTSFGVMHLLPSSKRAESEQNYKLMCKPGLFVKKANSISTLIFPG